MSVPSLTKAGIKRTNPSMNSTIHQVDGKDPILTGTVLNPRPSK